MLFREYVLCEVWLKVCKYNIIVFQNLFTKICAFLWHYHNEFFKTSLWKNYATWVLHKHMTSKNANCILNYVYGLSAQNWFSGCYFTGWPKSKFLKFVLAITLKISISDPRLVKPKFIWELSVFFEKCKQIFENWKKLTAVKHILALPTLGQICTITELQPFEISTFQMKHPVYTKARSFV